MPRLNFYGPPKSKVYNLKQNLYIEFQALDSKFHSALEPFSPFWWSVNETQPTLRGTVSLNFPRSAVLIGEKQKLGAVSINIFHHMWPNYRVKGASRMCKVTHYLLITHG